MKDCQELQLGNFKELIREAYFFLKDNKCIPISENAQNLDKEFYHQTEQLFINKTITENKKAELNDTFANASLEYELAGFVSGIYLTKNLLQYLNHIK